MNILKKYNLILRLICGIILGIILGKLGFEFVIKIFITFNSIFGSLLSFIIPLIILAFITNGISNLGLRSHKLLGITMLLSYGLAVLIGLMTFIISIDILPILLKDNTFLTSINLSNNLSPFFTFKISQIMPIITALILSFILGIGLSHLSNCTLGYIAKDFHGIIFRFISKVIVPLLPIYILGIFANMTYSGQVEIVVLSFIRVLLYIIGLHLTILAILFTIAGILKNRNPLILLKNMLPAYLMALGTQSSVATIPTTIASIKNNNIKSDIAEFVASLCVSIYMPGSIVTIISSAIAIMILMDLPITLMMFIPLILILGIGSSLMIAVGVLQSMLGFDESMVGLVIALYLILDSFITACNVTGDGATAVIIERITSVKNNSLQIL